MKGPARAHQSITFSRRMMLVGGAQGGARRLLVAPGLAVDRQNEHYNWLLPRSNRVQLIIVPPRRGWIVDRDGKPIAINRPISGVDIIPDQLEVSDRDARTLAEAARADADDVDRIIKELKAPRGYQPVPGRRECPLRPICGGHRAPARAARASSRCAASRASIRPARGRPPGRLCRCRLGQGI